MIESSMRYRLCDVTATFRYGALDTADNDLTCLDIKKAYQNLGGAITPDTEIDFDTYFPKQPYEKTALAECMPPNYRCEGSRSARIYQPDGKVDVISISVYRDTRGDQPIGDHHNLFLQYEINGKKTHTDRIENRHIPLRDGVVIKPFIDNAEICEKTAKIPKHS
jgi:hypothetical protein